MGNVISDDRQNLHSKSKLTEFVNDWALGNNTGTDLNYDDGYLYDYCNIIIDADKETFKRKYSKLLQKRAYCTANNQPMKIALPKMSDNKSDNKIVGNFEYSSINIDTNINLSPVYTETIDGKNYTYSRGDYKTSAAPNGCSYIYSGLDINNSVKDDCLFCKKIKNERVMMSDIFKLQNDTDDYTTFKNKLDPKNDKNYTDEFIVNQFKTYFNAYGRYHMDANQDKNVYNDCNCINSTLNSNPNLKTSNEILTTENDQGVNTYIAPKDIVNYLDIQCSATGSYVPDQVNSIGCLEIMNVKNVQVYNDSQAYFKQGCTISTNDKSQPDSTAPAGQANVELAKLAEKVEALEKQAEAAKAEAAKAEAEKADAEKAEAAKADAEKAEAEKAEAAKADVAKADAEKADAVNKARETQQNPITSMPVIIFGSASVVILIILIFIKKYITSVSLLKH